MQYDRLRKLCALAVCCVLLQSFLFWPTSTNAATVSNKSGTQALAMLKKNNAIYQKSLQSSVDISLKRRQETAQNGQNPYAIILACADSRVPPEHIFNAGIGELFVMRNAGNVTSQAVLGSMEYAVAHLGVKLIVVLGHTRCGAVGAALEHKHGERAIPSSLHELVGDIHASVKEAKDARAAEILNVKQEMQDIIANPMLQKLMQKNSVLLVGGIYNVDTGAVEFLP